MTELITVLPPVVCGILIGVGLASLFISTPDSDDAARFRFLDERFAATKTSASQRVIDDLRLGEGADPTDSLADIVDVAMLNS